MPWEQMGTNNGASSQSVYRGARDTDHVAGADDIVDLGELEQAREHDDAPAEALAQRDLQAENPAVQRARGYRLRRGLSAALRVGCRHLDAWRVEYLEPTIEGLAGEQPCTNDIISPLV